MKCIYRRLIISFSEICGFDGWMIAKAGFGIKKAENISMSAKIEENASPVKRNIIKQRRNYSVISQEIIYKHMEYTMVMHIVKPAGKQFPEKDCNYSKIFLCQLNYSKEDIRKFVDDTGDSNYIHRADIPVVPGFLMFEDVLYNLLYPHGAEIKAGNYIILFRNPVFAGEEINIFQTVNSGNRKIMAISSGVEKKVLWEVHYV